MRYSPDLPLSPIEQRRSVRAAFSAYETYADTLKIYTHAHGAKVRASGNGLIAQTTDLSINLDRDDYLLSDDSATLISVGLSARMVDDGAHADSARERAVVLLSGRL